MSLIIGLLSFPTQALSAQKCFVEDCPYESLDYGGPLSKCFIAIPIFYDPNDESVRECLVKAIRERPFSLVDLNFAIRDGRFRRTSWVLPTFKAFHTVLREKEETRYLQSWIFEAERNFLGQPTPEPIKYKVAKNGRTDAYHNGLAQVPGMVQVGSLYPNQDTVRGVTNEVLEMGTGTLVDVPHLSRSSQYVLTAAHLLGGKHPRVLLDGRSLEIKGVIINNDLDIAVIEVAKRGKAAFVYSRETKQFKMIGELEIGIRKGALPWVGLGSDSQMVGFSNELLRRFDGDRERMLQFKGQDGSGQTLGVFLNPWVDGAIQSYSEAWITEDISRKPLGHTFDRSQFVMRSKVPGGMSGAPVASSKGTPVLYGILTQSNYYFHETYAASARYLSQLLDKYSRGKTGAVSATTWKMRNRLTYREFSGGWGEANFIGQNTGRGVIGDTGKGVVGDPGKGVVGDPGGAVSEFSPWSEPDPSRIFSFYGLEPGMRLFDKPVIAIRAVPKQKKPSAQTLLFYADHSAIRFMRAHGKEYAFQPIETGADLLAHVLERFGKSQNKSTQLTIETGPQDWYAKTKAFYYEKFPAKDYLLEISESGIKVRLKTYSEDWRMKKKKAAIDIVEFALDRKGIPVGSKQTKFLPIIEARGLKSGSKYFIDIRRLFFTDLSQVSLPVFETDKSKLDKELRRQLKLYGVSARNADSDLEYGFTFARTK